MTGAEEASLGAAARREWRARGATAPHLGEERPGTASPKPPFRPTVQQRRTFRLLTTKAAPSGFLGASNGQPGDELSGRRWSKKPFASLGWEQDRRNSGALGSSSAPPALAAGSQRVPGHRTPAAGAAGSIVNPRRGCPAVKTARGPGSGEATPHVAGEPAP